MQNWPISTGSDGTPVAVTASTQTILVADTATKLVSEDLMIDNPGPNDVYVRAGDASVAATLFSVRVPAGSLQPFRKGTATHLALRCGAGLTQTVVVHVGEGQ